MTRLGTLRIGIAVEESRSQRAQPEKGQKTLRRGNRKVGSGFWSAAPGLAGLPLLTDQLAGRGSSTRFGASKLARIQSGSSATPLPHSRMPAKSNVETLGKAQPFRTADAKAAPYTAYRSANLDATGRLDQSGISPTSLTILSAFPRASLPLWMR